MPAAKAVPANLRSPVRLGSRGREAISGYLFLLPYLAVVGLFTVYPILHGLYISLFDYKITGDSSFVGLANYQRMLHDEMFWRSLWNTARFVLMNAPSTVVLGLALALLVDAPIRGKQFFRVIFFAPHVLSISVVATLWVWILQPQYGILNKLLVGVGLQPPQWLSDPLWAMPSVVVTTLWWTVGFNLIVFLAGLQEIPTSLYEAGRIDGAGPWALFRHITLPGLRRTMLFVTVNQVITSFQVFGQVFIMTQGGPYGTTKVLIQYVYENAFRYFRMGYGSAMAYALFLLLLVLTVIQFRLGGDEE